MFKLKNSLSLSLAFISFVLVLGLFYILFLDLMIDGDFILWQRPVNSHSKAVDKVIENYFRENDIENIFFIEKVLNNYDVSIASPNRNPQLKKQDIRLREDGGSCKLGGEQGSWVVYVVGHNLRGGQVISESIHCNDGIERLQIV